MRLATRPLAALALVALALAWVAHRPSPSRDHDALERSEAGESQAGERAEPGHYPSDWFAMQRAFPSGAIDHEAYLAALEQAQNARAAQPFTSQAIGQVWEQAGPYNIGGRVTALAVVPGGTTVYLGSANGGVFKSTNGGVNWSPLMDHLGVFSIGALALDPADPTVVYCGTGEANSSVDSYDGAGLFRSTDAGESWSYLGLQETRRIARVAVHPSDPNQILVAAMGTQFSTGPYRGIYRSTDGGLNWTNTLFVSDSTGACDVVYNPAHPETVYAATWERVRRPTYRRAFGPEGGIWRSIDSGATWTRLTNGLPPLNDNLGRIGLALAPSKPWIVYAQIITGSSGGYTGLGMYRTVDGGASWTRRDVSGFTGIFGGFGWYFGEMGVSPTNSETVYALGVNLMRSTDGGQNFFSILGSAHVDNHALWINPSNPNQIYLGNDGGFYSTTIGGSTWFKSVDLPITQFYAGTIDPSNSARLLGGTQDNNTLVTAGSPSGWSAFLGGDGFYCAVDPVNPNIVYAEWQYCCNNSGPRRFGPYGSSPDTVIAPAGFSGSDRYNWSTPLVMNPKNRHMLLVGSQRVYRSTNGGQAYAPISGDLTTNSPGLLLWSTISTLEVSPADTNVYYAGTDDGKVWRTLNRGGLWTDVTAGLPLRWVTRVTADPFAAGTVYVTLSGFGGDEHVAHVYRSTNQGTTWAPISGDLPNAPVNDLVVDPSDTQRLYVGTDLGVYTTRDLGASWYVLGQGLPLMAVFDLTLHQPSRTLVAASHSRSQWRFDLTTIPVAVGPSPTPPRLALSAPAPNPSRGDVSLRLDLPSAERVHASVFDALGRHVRTLHSGALGPGAHPLSWNGLDESGHAAAPGVYVVRAHAGAFTATQRIVRVR